MPWTTFALLKSNGFTIIHHYNNNNNNNIYLKSNIHRSSIDSIPTLDKKKDLPVSKMD